MSSSAHELKQDIAQSSPWNLAAIAGRFIEISASASTASLTLAFGLVREAQNQREPVGWVTSMESFFYPPDAAHGGVDLAALVVIRVLHAVIIPTAGEKLLRSGGFGLVVLDLGTADIPMPLQSRLTGLAQRTVPRRALAARLGLAAAAGRPLRPVATAAVLTAAAELRQAKPA